MVPYLRVELSTNSLWSDFRQRRITGIEPLVISLIDRTRGRVRKLLILYIYVCIRPFISACVPRNRLSTLLLDGLSSLWHTQSEIFKLMKEFISSHKNHCATSLCTKKNLLYHKEFTSPTCLYPLTLLSFNIFILCLPQCIVDITFP